MKKVADKLASFVAKNGKHFEHITRQKNPGDTPFKYVPSFIAFFFKIVSLQITIMFSDALDPGFYKILFLCMHLKIS